MRSDLYRALRQLLELYDSRRNLQKDVSFLEAFDGFEIACCGLQCLVDDERLGLEAFDVLRSPAVAFSALWMMKG